MQEENNYKVRLGIVLLLSIIASILMVIFTIPKANALVLRDPDSTTTVNNVTYSGYEIPTRITSVEGQSYVSVGTTNKTSNNDFSFNRNTNNYFYVHNNFDFPKLDNYVINNNIDLSSINYNMTYPIELGPLDRSDLMNVSFSFHPALEGDMEDTLSLGNYIDYNSYYSFTFDLVLYTDNAFFGDQRVCSSYQSNGSLIVSQVCSPYNGFLANNTPTLGKCRTLNTDVTYCNTGSAGYGYNITKVYVDGHLQVLKVKVLFNSSTQFKFSKTFDYSANVGINDGIQSFTSDINSSFFTNVNNFITSTSYLRNQAITTFEPVYMFVSQPYDITLWSESNHGFCDGSSCWTQEDTNNNSENKDNIDNYKQSAFFDDLMNGIQGLLGRDYGFSGIVNLTFDFIKDLIYTFTNQGSPVCYTVRVNILGKDIVLPCGSSFWYRSDMALWVFSTYNVIFLGALSYLLAWKIYKDLLDTFNPSSKIVRGSEVDSL